MADQPIPLPHRARTPASRYVAIGGAAVMAVAALLAIAPVASSADPSASPAGGPVASSPAAPAKPLPSLTFAPLVTLPPIFEPTLQTPTELADGNALGSPDAPVTVEVWADFQCPYCRIFSVQIEPQLISEYVATGKIRLVFRTLSFLGEESRWAAVAARLAQEQGRFWPYHDYLFANQLGENIGTFSLDRLLAIGREVGLDMDAFVRGLELDAARALYAELDAVESADAAALDIGATPTVVVNGVVTADPYFETVSAAIDAALRGGAASASPGIATPSPEASPGE